MKKEKIKSEIQVFVCNYKTCEKRGGRELADKLKKWSKEETNKEVKIFRSGCLGQCDNGVAIALFPEKKFILDAEESDFKEIRDQLHAAWKGHSPDN